MARISVFAASCLAQFLCSCTIVNVEDPSGHRSTVHVGKVSSLPESAGGITAYRTTVLGLGFLPNGPVLGYGNADTVQARDLSQCRIIIFELPKDPQEARTWQELIGQRTDICTLDKGDKQ